MLPTVKDPVNLRSLHILQTFHFFLDKKFLRGIFHKANHVFSLVNRFNS